MSRPSTDDYEPGVAAERLLPFYEHCYAYAAGRMDAVNSRLGFAAPVLTLIFGVLAFLVGGLPRLSFERVYIALYVFTALVIVAIAFTFYFLARTMIGYRSTFVGRLGEIDDSIRAITQWNHRQPEARRRDLQHELACFLLERYTYATDDTINQLVRKSAYYRRMLVSLYAAVFLLLAALVPYGIIRLHSVTCSHAVAVHEEVQVDGIQPGTEGGAGP